MIIKKFSWIFTNFTGGFVMQILKKLCPILVYLEAVSHRAGNLIVRHKKREMGVIASNLGGQISPQLAFTPRNKQTSREKTRPGSTGRKKPDPIKKTDPDPS